MYCSSCGVEMPDQFRFCPQCGTSAALGQTRVPAVPLRRSRDDKKLAGVCAGVARYLGADTTLIRILVVCAAFWGVGIIFYLACWILMPIDPLLLPPPPVSHPVVNSPVVS